MTERRRTRRRHRQRAAVPAVLLGLQQRRGPSAVGLLHDAPRAAAGVGDARSAAARVRATSAPKCFSSLVDPAQAPFSGDLRQLSIQTLCTNRDLVLQMPIGLGQSDLSLDVAAPVAEHPRDQRAEPSVSRRWPTAPSSWRAISHLSLNYLSLVQSTPGGGRRGAARSARAVRGDADVEREAADRGDPVGAASSRVVRRLPAPGPLAFGRGLEITLQVDELAFEGGSAFLLGSVLDRYFARHVSINSFTETVLRSAERGEINRWVPQWGARPTL